MAGDGAPPPLRRLRWGGNWRRRAFLLLFLAFCGSAVVALNRHIDPDLFWHLRGGGDIVRAGKAVLPDSWTYLFEGRPWVNQQWASEVLFHAFFSAGGYAGLQILKGLLICGMVLFVLGALRRHSPAVRYASAAFFMATTGHYFIFRTHLLTLLCLSALVFLLERFEARRRLGWVLLLFALWANLHTLFSLGLIVMGCYVSVRWLQRGRRFDAEALWDWASLPLACAATLCNPFGWKVWQTLLTVSGDPATAMVTEWWPIWRHSFDQNLGIFSLAVLVTVLGVFFPKDIHWPSFAAAGGIAFLGVLHVRFTADVPLPAMPLVASLLTAVAARAGARVERAASRVLPTVAGALVVLSASAFSYSLAHPLVTPGDLLRVDYPVRAVEWMKRRHLSGWIFNDYVWGGYLCWQLPDSRVFIDPRTGVLLFPNGFVGAWKDAVETRRGWRETLEQGHPDFVLLVLDNYLSAQLDTEPGWELLFKDEISVLYGRRGDSENPILPGG